MSNYLIIGGSSGIGKCLADLLADDGFNIYATYNQNAISSDKTNIHFHQLNVLSEEISLDFLPEIIDGFIYCPGSINLKPFSRIKPSDFLSDFELQVNGAIKILQQILPKLKQSKNASILFFSSVAAQNGFNFHSQISVSKGAIEGLTKSLAAEFAPTIRVNAIAPSLTNTPLASKLLNSEAKIKANAERHPLKKIGVAKDIALMAKYLISEQAQWITGQIFHVDGGMSTIKI